MSYETRSEMNIQDFIHVLWANTCCVHVTPNNISESSQNFVNHCILDSLI